MNVKTTRMIVIATVVSALSLPALAQYVPAGMQGTWRIHKWLNPHHAGAVGSCLGGVPSKALIGTDLSLGEHTVVWQGTTVQDAQPKMSTMSSADFATQYLADGTLKDLGISGTEVQLLTLGARGDLPFDTVIVRNPSTLIFERCGFFYEAVRHGSFIAPKLPNQ